MNATLFALAGAVLTLLVYYSLTEPLDYATVRRRQLDAWAALSALACLAGIVYGSLDVRREASQRDAIVLDSVRAPVEIQRLRQPVLSTPRAVAASELVEREAPLSVAAVTPPEIEVLGGPVPDREVGDERAASEEGLRGQPLDRAPGIAAVGDDLAQPAELPAPPRLDLVVVAPTPTLQRVITRAPVAITAIPTPAVIVPPIATLVPPQPTQPAPPTPYCGDPEDIHMAVRIDEAYVDRESDPQVVRYRGQIRNEADFPVVASQMVVTAQDSRSGSDQFGSDRRPDMRIEGGHGIDFEGAVKLEKFPSPFGRSELCISFVTDTCGRQAEFPTMRRCFSIRGF